MASRKLIAVDFEVFGMVQGVFFRKYTEEEAKVLGIRGWCMNTYHETVKGQLEGPQDKIYTEDQSKKLGLRGWCKNTRQRTVVGQLEGPQEMVTIICCNTALPFVRSEHLGDAVLVLKYYHHPFYKARKDWLRKTGSPSSRIEKAEFKNEKEISDYTFSGFSVRH